MYIYIYIYRQLFFKCFKNTVLGRQEMVQYKYFSLTPNRNMFAVKVVRKSERFLAILQSMLFSMSSELRFVK